MIISADNRISLEWRLEALNPVPDPVPEYLPHEAEDDDYNDDDDDDKVMSGPRFEARVELAATISKSLFALLLFSCILKFVYY